jgi:two-component system, NtrC family, C4-dicarboxylate transport sensor histidine kinase DctB
MENQEYKREKLQIRTSLLVRFFIILFIIFGILLILITNLALTAKFSQETAKQAELRLQLYINTIESELERNRFITLLIAGDPKLHTILRNNNVKKVNQYVQKYTKYYKQNIKLLGPHGSILAKNEESLSNNQHTAQKYFKSALQSDQIIFTTILNKNNKNKFIFSQVIKQSNKILGVVINEVSLSKTEDAWIKNSEAVIVTNKDDKILLSSKPNWFTSQIANQTPPTKPNNLLNSVQSFTHWEELPPRAFLNKNTLLQLETRLNKDEWRIIYYTTYAPVRAKVNGIIALEITALAILLTLIFYLLSRRSRIQSIIFMEESNNLRLMNSKLQNEMDERERVEQSLKVAEQSLAQNSKLAALGEMSAAVSHELNQPLAAMKTYLAGAKLLLQRSRSDEALSSFQRIDDLIERMATITKQLKSHARKGSNELVEVDLKMVISDAIDIMSSQFNLLQVDYSQNLPKQPVIVLGDQIRLEQVMINLLRNSLDAMANTKAPKLEILLNISNNAVISVKDNGQGIVDLESLFEPFYTTKKPGDGVGLGLAISSGIINDLGGRLVARNNEISGAVFEIYLPTLNST